MNTNDVKEIIKTRMADYKSQADNAEREGMWQLRADLGNKIEAFRRLLIEINSQERIEKKTNGEK